MALIRGLLMYRVPVVLIQLVLDFTCHAVVFKGDLVDLLKLHLDIVHVPQFLDVDAIEPDHEQAQAGNGHVQNVLLGELLGTLKADDLGKKHHVFKTFVFIQGHYFVHVE